MSLMTKPSISDIIEDVGFGATHVRQILTGGGVWFADGLELSLISAISVSVSTSLHVGPELSGVLVTFVYLGVMLGNLFCGPVGDRLGRRFCILTSYLGIFIFSILSSFAPNFVSLLGLRLMVGASFGFGQPVWNTLAAEVSPGKYRVLVNALSQSLFTCGEIYAYVLVYMDNPWMKDLDWRLLLREAAIPSAVFFVVASIWLLQSPVFLAATGRNEEAREVLQIMHRDNCIPSPSLDFHYHEAAPRGADDSNASEYRTVLSGPLLVTTCIVTYSCFVMNFVYYGLLYAYPQVLPAMSKVGRSSSPAMELIIAAFCEFPGYPLAVIFCWYFARKPIMKMYLFVQGAAIIAFAAGAFNGFSSTLWHIGMYASKFNVDIGYVVLYVYASEVYPTKVRTTGCGVSFAGGRIGAMLAPLAYELLTSWTQTYLPFFLIAALLCLTNVPLIDLLPETSGSTSLGNTTSEYGSAEDSESALQQKAENAA